MENIFEYLKINDKSQKKSFIDLITLESNSNHEMFNKSFRPYIYLFKMIIGIIVSDTILFLSKKLKSKIEQITFVTHYSHIVKVIGLYNIFNDTEFTVLYVPTFHNEERKKHYDTLKNKNNVIFDFFGLKVFIKSLFLIKDLKRINDLSNEFPDKKTVFINILKYKIYSFYTEKRIRNSNNCTLWIFDNDKSPIFSPLVKELNIKNIPTINLQHGSFFENNLFYSYPITKYTFTCSEREKLIFEKYIPNVEQEKIKVIGAPLQTFSHNSNNNINSAKIQYDLLVLLTSVSNDKFKEIQRKIITTLNELNDLNILVRFRPASKHLDEALLKSKISNKINISNDTLSNDINNSKKIITFSFDALFNCIIDNKQVIIICDDEKKAQLKPMSSPICLPFSHIDSLKSAIYTNNSFDKLNFIWNFGEYNKEIYSLNFKKLCYEIIKS